jgi:hypothetical protein
MQQLETSEWWLWGFAITVTLVLTVGIVSLTFPGNQFLQNSEWFDLKEWVRGLACLVLLFDIYTVYQQLQLQRIRRELTQRNQLFEVITENAADMIAVIDCAGHRLYNSARIFARGISDNFVTGTSPSRGSAARTGSSGESQTYWTRRAA